MNKNTISWIHYAYATITASVLAYVTVMDSDDTQSESDNAVSMLPSFDNDSQEKDDKNIEEVLPKEPELYEDEIPSAQVFNNEEPVIAEPVSNEDYRGGKLKRKNTKIKHMKLKNNKTRSRK